MLKTVILLFYVIYYGYSKIYEIDLDAKLQTCLDREGIHTGVGDAVGLTLYSNCINVYASNFMRKRMRGASPKENLYINSLLNEVMGRSGRIKRQASNRRRVRYEIRQLTVAQRETYNNAVNELKRRTLDNGTSRYDVIAARHSGVFELAHIGPVFGAWHMIYLLVYEAALRRVNPSVTVPYYASHLDDAMEISERVNSVVWSDIMFGNCDGLVRTGPFANWDTPNGPLIRQCGLIGSPYTYDGIDRIMSQRRNRDIFHPRAEFRNNLEVQHDAVHAWVGGGNGQITRLDFAAYDPVFFNHHAFVDKLWHEFKINKTMDYPPARNPIHRPNRRLGFGRLRNRDAFVDLSRFYSYEPLPTCDTGCEASSPFYTCSERLRNRCRSLSISEARGIGGRRSKRQTAGTSFPKVTKSRTVDKGACDGSSLKRSMQNAFYIDGIVDSSKWVYIAMDVIYLRPPEKQSYNSYPIVNGKTMKTWDIYSSHMNSRLQSELKKGNPQGYGKCEDPSMNAAQIFIGSHGLNYYGDYKEYMVLDKRMAVTSNIGYVAVKSPENGDTEAIISAHDSCGRICKAYCLVPGSKSEYRQCNGGIKVTNQEPKMYGKTIAECVDRMWKFPKNKHCPSTVMSDVFIKFFCDFKEDWPWVIKNTSIKPEVTSPPRVEHIAKDCVLDQTCTIKRRCGSCYKDEKHICIQTNNAYAKCLDGKFHVMKCCKNFYFDDKRKICIYRLSNRRYGSYRT